MHDYTRWTVSCVVCVAKRSSNRTTTILNKHLNHEYLPMEPVEGKLALCMLILMFKVVHSLYSRIFVAAQSMGALKSYQRNAQRICLHSFFSFISKLYFMPVLFEWKKEPNAQQILCLVAKHKLTTWKFLLSWLRVFCFSFVFISRSIFLRFEQNVLPIRTYVFSYLPFLKSRRRFGDRKKKTQNLFWQQTKPSEKLCSSGTNKKKRSVNREGKRTSEKEVGTCMVSMNMKICTPQKNNCRCLTVCAYINEPCVSPVLFSHFHLQHSLCIYIA